MKLLLVHQILIGAAVGLAAIFGIRAFLIYLRGGATTDLVLALVSILVGAALLAYLRKVRARWLREQKQPP